jgi:hypothetical protein
MGGRLDTWVFRVSIAVPLVCIAALVLWHLVNHLVGKLVNKRKVIRHSPEPPLTAQSSRRLPGRQPLTGIARTGGPGAVADSAAPASSEVPHEERIRQARELLSLSREELSNQRFLSSLEGCEALATAFSDLPRAAEIKQLAAQIKNDLNRLQEVCTALADSFAELPAR